MSASMGGSEKKLSPAGLVWATFATSAGMMADGYDLMVVDVMIAIVSSLHPNEVTPEKQSMMACMAYAGIISGMFIFGRLADVMGHKCAGIVTTVLTVLGCIGSASCRQSEYMPLANQLTLCRFCLGLGIGGEYPVSMTMGSGRRCGNLFADAGLFLVPAQVLLLNTTMFHVGSIFAPALSAILLGSGLSLDSVWRLVVLFGVLPSLGAFMARLQLPQHRAESSSEDADLEPANARVSKRLGTSLLLGCCLAAAVFNFLFFGQSAFRSLLDQHMFAPSGNLTQKLQHHVAFGFYLSLLSIFAGVVLLILARDHSLYWGQLTYFITASLMSGLCSLLLRLHARSGWVFLAFCLQMLPLTAAGMCTYAIPPQYLPTEILGTACGIVAAAAKAGALAGTVLVPFVERTGGPATLLLVTCGVSAAGAVTTLALTPRHPPAEPGELRNCRD